MKNVKNVPLTWAAWHGDLPVTVTFPDLWDVRVIENERLPALSFEEISNKLNHPAGCSSLSELAKGKKNAAILIDDITRPTPTDILLPLIIRSLEAGGIQRSDINVIIAGGAHRETEAERIFKKTGSALASGVRITVHSSEDDLIYLGRTEKGTPIHINKIYMACDLKIGIGTILPHPIAGFSGGSKIVVPGVCGSETIQYLHDYTQCYQHNYHNGPGKRTGVVENVFRKEIDEICDIVGMDFLVNVVLTPAREILDLFAGSWKQVFALGVRAVSEIYRVKPFRADVIVANTYPFDTDMRYMLRGFWPLYFGNQGATKVIIGYGGDGMGAFGSKTKNGSLMKRLIKRLKKLQPGQLHNEIKVGISILRKKFQLKKLDYIVFSPTIKNRDLASILPESTCFDQWEDVLEEIKRRHPPKNITVAVYPCAPLQYPDA